MARKRRTRQHVIADLGINYVERQALLAGFAVERFQHDYGLDLYISTYDGSGAVENGFLLMQVKATDHLNVLADGQTIALRVEWAHLDWWLGEDMPVILVVYDGQGDVAYHLDVKQYFVQRRVAKPSEPIGTLTLHLAIADRLDDEAFRRFTARKNAILREGTT